MKTQKQYRYAITLKQPMWPRKLTDTLMRGELADVVVSVTDLQNNSHIYSNTYIIGKANIGEELNRNEVSIPVDDISVSDDGAFVRYETGYVTFGRFDEDGDSSERLSHWVDWFGDEPYSTTDDALYMVLIRILDACSMPSKNDS